MLNSFRFHHIGYAVKDIEKTAEYYVNSGWIISDIIIDRIQNSKIAFLKKQGMPPIELVAPVNEKSPIINTLKKNNGSTIYHVCYEVDNIDAAVAELRKMKYIKLFNPVEAAALNNRKICYLFNKEVGLIEVIEK